MYRGSHCTWCTVYTCRTIYLYLICSSKVHFNSYFRIQENVICTLYTTNLHYSTDDTLFVAYCKLYPVHNVYIVHSTQNIVYCIFILYTMYILYTVHRTKHNVNYTPYTMHMLYTYSYCTLCIYCTLYTEQSLL